KLKVVEKPNTSNLTISFLNSSNAYLAQRYMKKFEYKTQEKVTLSNKKSKLKNFFGTELTDAQLSTQTRGSGSRDNSFSDRVPQIEDKEKPQIFSGGRESKLEKFFGSESAQSDLSNQSFVHDPTLNQQPLEFPKENPKSSSTSS